MHKNKKFNSFIAGVTIFVLMFGQFSSAFAAIWTDKDDYSPGETVTISGDEYAAGETVDIAVSAPYGQVIGQSSADEAGNFVWQFILPNDDSALGEYSYTATGRESGISFNGTFTDASVTSAPLTVSPPSVVSGSPVTASTTISVNPTNQTADFRIQWFNPSNVLVKSTLFEKKAHNSLHSDTYTTPDAVGTWTVKTCKGKAALCTGGTVLDSKTFTVTAPSPATGSIKIVKNTIGGDGTFEFTSNFGVSSLTTSGGTASQTVNGLAIGSGYNINETVPPGWNLTGYECDRGNINAIEVVAGQTTICTFINTKLGSISGMKFEDMNADGNKDSGDNGLASWTIFIDRDGDGELDAGETSVTTISGGTYFFGGLSAGPYSVCEQEKANWHRSFPAASNCQDVTVTAGQDTPNINFGNYQYATISGYKFEDMNGDGDITEDSGLEGWTIKLSGDDSDSTTTDEDGYYSFFVKPGSYTVCEILKNGWIQTYPAGEYDHSDNCDQGNGYQVTVYSGDAITLDFGNFKLGKISGYKFLDIDGDGIWETGEPGLSGWTIKLNNTESETTTDSSGYYKFTDLGPGTYTICEALKTGYSQTLPKNEGGCYEITMTSGLESEDNNFGNKLNICFKGLTPPVSHYSWKNFQRLSTIPVKFQLVACEKNSNGSWIFGEPIPDEIAKMATAKLEVCKNGNGCKDAVSSGGANDRNIFRYSATGRQFIFNLSTKLPSAWWTQRTIYNLNITIDSLVLAESPGSPAARITIR